jgi:tetratricopeptide (TPR) repeat protein
MEATGSCSVPFFEPRWSEYEPGYSPICILAMDDISNLLTTAEAYEQADNLELAIRYSKSALVLDAENAIALSLLARLTIRTEDFVEGRRLAELLIANAPQNDAGYYLAAICLLQAGETDDAIQSASTAVELAPFNPLTHIVLASCLRAANKWSETEAALRNALEADPAYATGKVRYADFLLERGRLHEAKRLLDEVLAQEPDNRQAILLRGKTALVEGDADRALDDARRVLWEGAVTEQALWLLVQAKARKGRFVGLLMWLPLWITRFKVSTRIVILAAISLVSIWTGLFFLWIARLLVVFLTTLCLRIRLRRELSSVRLDMF